MAQLKNVKLRVEGESANISNEVKGRVSVISEWLDMLWYDFSYKVPPKKGDHAKLTFTDKQKETLTFDFDYLGQDEGGGVGSIDADAPEIVLGMVRQPLEKVLNFILNETRHGKIKVAESTMKIDEELYQRLFESEILENKKLRPVAQETGVSVQLLKKAKYSLLPVWSVDAGHEETFKAYKQIIDKPKYTEEQLLPIIKRIIVLSECFK